MVLMILIHSKFGLSAFGAGRVRVYPDDDLAEVITASKKVKTFVSILEPDKDARDNRCNPVLRDKVGCSLQIGLRAHGRA